jgi:flagellum-specific ATP synthase
MPACNAEAETALVDRARRMLSTYDDMAELIRIGAYRQGSDPAVDEAIRHVPAIEAMLKQGKTERARLADGYAALAAALGEAWPPAGAGADA